MVPLFFLIAFDSLPPLPAPTDLRCPEPTIQFNMNRDSLRAEAYFGRYYGGGISFARTGFSLAAAYARDEIWFSGADCGINTAAALPIEHLWLRPFFDGQWIKRTDDHWRLGAGIDVASDLPGFVLTSGIRLDRWHIPGVDNEAVGYLSIFGDRFKIMPQADLNAIYRMGSWFPSVTARLHAGEFHIGLGSLLSRGFPSPRFDLEYRTLRIVLGIGIRHGVVHNPLTSYYDRDKPYRYRLPLSPEDLTLGIEGKCRLTIGSIQLGGDAALLKWRNRLAPDDSFYLNLAHDLDEWRVNLFFAVTETISRVKIRHALYLRYEKISKGIPDEPKYKILDTLALYCGPAYASLEIKYLHDREGSVRTLPRLILMNTRIGMRYKSFDIFGAVFNLANNREKIFEDYYPGSRQVVGGIGLKL